MNLCIKLLDLVIQIGNNPDILPLTLSLVDLVVNYAHVVETPHCQQVEKLDEAPSRFLVPDVDLQRSYDIPVDQLSLQALQVGLLRPVVLLLLLLVDLFLFLPRLFLVQPAGCYSLPLAFSPLPLFLRP